jgi:hypothetical protein
MFVEGMPSTNMHAVFFILFYQERVSGGTGAEGVLLGLLNWPTVLQTRRFLHLCCLVTPHSGASRRWHVALALATGRGSARRAPATTPLTPAIWSAIQTVRAALIALQLSAFNSCLHD